MPLEPPRPGPPPIENSPLKETYLQLLPHPVLVSLVLALDKNHDAVIWPTDLASAIDSLRAYAKRLYAPTKTPIAPIAPAALPPSVGGPHQNGSNRPPGALAPPLPSSRPLPTVVPGRPLPPLTASKTAYAPPPFGAPASQIVARVPTQRNATGRPPNGPGSGGMPSYEEMIVVALEEISDPDGLAPKTVFDYMSSHWPLMNNFRPSASQALQKAYKRGRLEKIGGKYRLDPTWEGGNTSKRTTRRPQSGELDSATPARASSSFSYSSTSFATKSTVTSGALAYPSTRFPLVSSSGTAIAGMKPNGTYARSSAGYAGKAPTLSRIKHESGAEEDELEDEDEYLDDEYGPESRISLRDSLLRLSELLQEKAAGMNGDPAGAG